MHFYIVLMCKLRQIQLYIKFFFFLYLPVSIKRLSYCEGFGEYSCTYRLSYCRGMRIDCLIVELLETTAVHIDCLIVEVLENTAVHIDCLTARVTDAFSFCEKRVWVMRYVHTDLYVINIVCFLLSALKHVSRLRF